MNLFPCTVTLPGGDTHIECRIVSDGRQVTVWRWSGREYEVVLEAPASDVTTREDSGYVKLPDGVATFAKGGSCGCSNPLKATTPTLTAGARRIYTSPA